MTQLPFAPHRSAATAWLEGLQNTGTRVRVRHLCQALQQLNAANVEGELRLPLLETLRPEVYVVSEVLAREFSRQPPEEARKTARLSILPHQELAAGYEQLPPKPHAALAGQRALASVGQMILRIIQLGEVVGSTLWRRLYTLYLQGEQEGWLHQPVPDPLASSTPLSALDQFKCVLGFIALTPMRFECPVIPRILSHLQQHKNLLEISETPPATGWYFDPHQPYGPGRADRAPARNSVRYLRIGAPTKAAFVESVQRRLSHHLGSPDDLEYPVQRHVEELWCGWDSVTGELKRQMPKSAAAGGWLEAPEFELTLPDAAGLPSLEETIPDWRRVHRHADALLRKRRGEPLAILETKAKLRAGDLIGMKLLDETLLLAVIRWAQSGAYGGRRRFGLDLFEGRARQLKAVIPGVGPTTAIHIQSPDAGTALLLPSIRLKPGILVLAGDEEFQIVRLLEWTDGFSAYRASA